MQPVPKSRRVGLATLAALLLLGPLALVTTAVVTASPAAAFGASEPYPIPSISAGGYISCGVQADQTVACWGENGIPSNDVANLHPGGAATAPAGQFLQVNSGYATSCGVKTDRSVVCWGSGRFEKVQSVPPGQYKHVVPGLNYVCALRTDDGVTCWGGDEVTVDPAQKVIRDLPPGAFTQIGVGARHACALRADGSIRCWGHNSGVNGAEGQTNVPGGNDTPGLYKYVTVGNFTSCALKMDNTPVCWGRTTFGQAIYPTGTFTRIDTGFAHVCGLRPDSTITCWGRNSEGQSSPVPAGTYTQVTTGTFHTCAMPTSGAPARCWGNNMSGRVQPNMNNVQPPKGYAGVAYNATFTMNPSPLSGAGAKVGISPAPSFSIVDGALPPGLSLAPSGAVSGTPTAAGSYTVKVAASNGLSPTDCSKVSNTGDSMFCTPGDPNSLATATRVLTFNIAADAEAPGAVAGRVTKSSDGSAVAGATVSVAYNDTTAVAQTTTNGDGNYTVAGLSPEGYKVTVSGEGIVTSTKSATVASEQTTTLDFSVTPRLTRPQIVGVWSNHWQTVADGVFVEWSEEFDVLQQVAAGYSVHGPSDSTCTAPAVATGVGQHSNWLGENPNTTTPRTPSRMRDVEMSGYDNVTPGATYHLRVAANTEFGASTGQQNLLTCLAFVAGPRPLDAGSVSGKVTDSATGAPIAGATVTVNRTIRQPGTAAGQATTDANGNYSVAKLAPSNYPIGGYNSPYQVVVSAPGYSSNTASATTTFTHTGTSPGTSSATLNVGLSNTAPDAVDDAYATDEDTALTVGAPGVLANDSDPQGDTLTAAVATGPANGTLALNADGSFTYTPNANYNGADSFTYTATDSLGASDTATVALTVNPVNDAPVASGESYTHYGSDTALVVAAPGVLGNDADIDADPLTAVLVSGAVSGEVTLNADGSFTYHANEDFVGTDSFTYKANDGSADSNVVTVSITVGAGCNGQQATIVGTGGDDLLAGTAGNDVIVGLGGNDIINGAGGNDKVCGGSGLDTIDAGTGHDYAHGGSGDDTVKGDVGNDTLLGGTGADGVIGDAGNDKLSGGTGEPDTCVGGDGTDSLGPDHGCEAVLGVP